MTNIENFKPIIKKMDQKNVTKRFLGRIVNGIYHNKIIALLEKSKYQTVNKIADSIKLDQPPTSVILREFKILKIVDCQIDGKFRRYSLNKERYEEIIATYTQIEIHEKEQINKLFETTDTKERDPLVYKQRSPILTD